eukprot:68653_1
MSTGIIVDYFASFDAASDQQLLDNIIYSIHRLGRNTFLNIMQKGLECIQHENSQNSSRQMKLILLTISSITANIKSNTHDHLRMHIFNIFNHYTMDYLCPFLSIHDQLSLQQTCRHFRWHLPHVDVQRHTWMEIPHHLKLCQLIHRFDDIKLKNKTFETIKITGESKYNWSDVLNIEHSEGLSLSDDTIQASKQREKDFCHGMGYWFFIMCNICKDKGTFIGPKLQLGVGLRSFIFETNRMITEKKQIYHEFRYAQHENQINVPKKIVFQCIDADSISENSIDFFLNRVEDSIDSIKNLLNNCKIQRIYVVRKYGIFDKTLHDKVLNRAGVVFGEAFGNRKNKFVVLRKRNNKYYTIYLRFTKELVDKYTPKPQSEPDHDESELSDYYGSDTVEPEFIDFDPYEMSDLEQEDETKTVSD